MPIGPVSDSLREISVIEPLNPAFEHVKRMLFKPFDITKWFIIGFCAWLATLGESGGGNVHFPGGNTFNSKNGGQPPDLHHAWQQVHDYVTSNLSWLLPLTIAVIVLAIALGITFLWLNSRGKFMFLDCVAHDKAQIVDPWKKYAAAGNSLFWFRLVLGLIGSVLSLPLLVFIAILIIRMFVREQANAGAIMLCIGLGFVFTLLAVVFAVIQKFLVDFVVPIMYLRGARCMDAWKEFYGMLSRRPGLFTLYVLFQIVIALAIGVLTMFVVLLTCCIAGCLFAIPYLGTVLMLPVLVFTRAYSLYFLRQFGSNYDVFPSVPPPPTPPAPGLQPL